MPPRAKAWLAREVPSQPGAAIVGFLFLAGAMASVAAGGILPAVVFGVGVAFVLVAYLATYGAAWPPRGNDDRPG